MHPLHGRMAIALVIPLAILNQRPFLVIGHDGSRAEYTLLLGIEVYLVSETRLSHELSFWTHYLASAERQDVKSTASFGDVFSMELPLDVFSKRTVGDHDWSV